MNSSKVIFFLMLFIIAQVSSAKDIKPNSLSAQYLFPSMRGDYIINFTFTIEAKTFTDMDFSSLSITSETLDNYELAPSQTIYRKSSSTEIVGSQVFSLSYNGLSALYVIKNLKNLKLKIAANNGMEFSISIKDQCLSSPRNFVNISGGTGCNVDQEYIEELIQEAEAANETVISCKESQEYIKAHKYGGDSCEKSDEIKDFVEDFYKCKLECKNY